MTCPLTIRSCAPYANHADVMNAFENTCINGGNINNTTISGGTINGTPIGGVTPAAGTFSQVTVNNAAAASLFINRPGGQIGQIVYQTGGSTRWAFFVTNASEAGSNAGSDFVIARYSDAGSFLGNAIFIERASSDVVFGRHIIITGDLDHNGSNVGFYGATPVARGALAEPSGTITRTTFATTTVTLPQLAERVYAVIHDLRLMGLFS